MREKWATIVVVGAVCVGLLVYLVVYSVPVDKVAVHKRFGKVVRVIRPQLGLESEQQQALPKDLQGVELSDRAGWYFKLPWPFDKVTWYDQRVQLVDGPTAQIQLADEYQLIPRVYATWRVVDPVAFEKSLKGDSTQAEQRLKTIVGNQTGVVFGKRRLSDVANTDPKQLKFDEIEQEIFKGVRDSLSAMDNAYGVDVSSLGITWIALPEGTTEAVFKRMTAERQRLADKRKAEGQSEKDMKIAQAEAEKQKVLSEADAEATTIRAQAEVEAATYYNIFAQDKDLANFLRELSALKNIAQSASDARQPLTVVLTTKNPPFNLFEGAFSAQQPAGAAAEPPKTALPSIQEMGTAGSAVETK
jgi:membrane protease subunit HflC